MGENSLTAAHYPRRLLEDLRQLYTQSELVDTTLTLAECGTMFYAHRCVLVAASPFFKALLEQEKLSQDITIKSVSAESFQRLLDFLYSGELKLTADSVWQVHAAAAQLQVAEASVLCQEYISSLSDDAEEGAQLTSETEVPSLELASVKLEPRDYADEEVVTPARRTRGRRPKVKVTPKIKNLSPILKKSPKKAQKVKKEDFTPPQVPSELKLKLHQLLKPKGSSTKKSKGNKKSVPIEEVISDDDRDEDYIPALQTSTKRSSRVGGQKRTPRKASVEGENSSASPKKRVKKEKSPAKSASTRGRPKKGEIAHSSHWVDASIKLKNLPRVECALCAYKFHHRAALQLHMRKHYVIREKSHIINCYNSTRKLKSFRLVKQVVNGFECAKCNKTFQLRSYCLAHLRKVHSRKLTCKKCKKPHHVKRLRLLRSCSSFLTSRSYSCNWCCRQFKSNKILYEHSKEHNDDVKLNTYKCRHCARRFTKIDLFVIHLAGHGLNDKELDLEFTEPSKVPLRMTLRDIERDDTNPLPFKCPHCIHRYKKLQDLNVHMMNKHNQKVLPGTKTPQVKKIRCEEDDGKCNKAFSRMTDLRKHLSEDHADASYDCYLCKYNTPVKRLLMLHVKYKHTNLEDRTCQQCGKHFRKRYHYRIHMVSKHGHEDPEVKIFTCGFDGCEYKTYARYVLDIHMKKHNKEKNYACTICGRKLKSQKAVDKHVSKVHMGIRPFICDICGASYGEEHELKMHIVRHSDVKQFQCEHCDYATHDKGNFQSHMVVKHGIQVRKDITILTCDRCAYSTWIKSRFQEHLNSHENIRNYNCPVCDKTFITKTTLNQHVKWMHSEERIKCPFCQYQAPVRKQLTAHIRTQHTHRNHKPFGCAYCDFKSRSSQNCRKHIMQKHKNQEVKWIKLYSITADDVHRAMSNAMNNPFDEPFKVDKNVSVEEDNVIHNELETGNGTKDVSDVVSVDMVSQWSETPAYNKPDKRIPHLHADPRDLNKSNIFYPNSSTNDFSRFSVNNSNYSSSSNPTLSNEVLGSYQTRYSPVVGAHSISEMMETNTNHLVQQQLNHNIGQSIQIYERPSDTSLQLQQAYLNRFAMNTKLQVPARKANPYEFPFNPESSVEQIGLLKVPDMSTNISPGASNIFTTNNPQNSLVLEGSPGLQQGTSAATVNFETTLAPSNKIDLDGLKSDVDAHKKARVYMYHLSCQKYQQSDLVRKDNKNNQ